MPEELSAGVPLQAAGTAVADSSMFTACLQARSAGGSKLRPRI
jgi:hypothetical protein